MAQRIYEEKIEIAETLMDMTPTDRISYICEAWSDRALTDYSLFLEKMQSAAFRSMLLNITADRKGHTPEFKRMKNNGHHFTWHLLSALSATYHPTHPIHKCLVI
jgi:hypothetical protein